MCTKAHLHVCVSVRATQTQQDGTSLTLNPLFSSFTSLCVIKMLIETKSAKRYVITCVYECELESQLGVRLRI